MGKKYLKIFAITMGLVILCTTCLYAGTKLQPITANLNYGLTVAKNNEVVDLGYVNGEKVIPITYNDTTYLPARAIANALGVSVDWNSDYQCVLLDGSGVPDSLIGNQGFVVEETKQPTRTYSESDVIMMAKLMFGEARGIQSQQEIAAIGWIVLNRVDDSRFPNTISGVITQQSQFHYKESFSTKSDYGYDLTYIARHVLDSWCAEKEGLNIGGRVLPKDYLYFHGANGRNHFKKTVNSKDYWNFSLPNPYAD